ncbi:MAG: hypothetical protein ACI4RG_02235 [Huintestinicola sp.]
MASVTLGKSNAKILSTAEERLSKVSIALYEAETADVAAVDVGTVMQKSALHFLKIVTLEMILFSKNLCSFL